MNREYIPEIDNSPKLKKNHMFSFNNQEQKTNVNKEIGQRPRSAGFRSFLRWFKKVENSQHRDSEESIDSKSVSSEEDSSSSSTATVASFAFLPANKYKPYGDASQPEKFFSPGPYTETYNRLIQERDKRRYLDKNISLRKKYSLYSSGTIKNENSNVENNNRNLNYDTFSLPSYGHSKMNGSDEIVNNRKTASLSNRTVKSHVKGKRKAPLPPINPEFIKSYRKKRKAPPPPLIMPVSNNILKDNNPCNLPSPKTPLKHADVDEKCKKNISQQQNVDISSPNPEISPRPWYKRESKTKPKNTVQDFSKRKKHEFPDVGFFRCSQLFENLKNINSDRFDSEMKNEKRTSRMLANISELDREAAEIIKHHKSTVENGETDNLIWKVNIVNNPSSARELISKFNAMSNAQNNTKVEHESNVNEIEKNPNRNVVKKDKSNQINPDGENDRNQKLKNIKGKSGPNNLSKNSNKYVQMEGELGSLQTEIFSALSNLTLKEESVKETTDKFQTKLQSHKTTDEIEEKLKLREMLKEMKNSLPKKVKSDHIKEYDDKTQFENLKIPSKVDDPQPSSKLSHRLSIIKEVFQPEEKSALDITSSELKTNDSSNKINLVKSNIEKSSKIPNVIKIPNTHNNSLSTGKVSSFAQTKGILCKNENINSLNIEKENTDSKPITNLPINPGNLYANIAGDKIDKVKSNLMDNTTNKTNILLKKLEQAITEGNDTDAAKLAKDLAVLKVNCLVICSPQTNINETTWKKINIYIEDQFSHQGPLPLQIPENTKMIELKDKVSKEFNIPIAAQRWIIGKQLADDDNTLLSQYNKNDFEIPLFLYIVTLEKSSGEQNLKIPIENNQLPSTSKTEPIITEKTKLKSETEQTPSTSNMLNVSNNIEMKNVVKNTWICSKCTLINSLLSPLCSACGTKKLKILEEQQNVTVIETTLQENERDINHYMELLNLDNRNLVLNVDNFDCPICLMDCGPQTGVILKECLHTFCKECLENTIKYSDEAEMRCPYRDDTYSCNSIIQDREIRAIVGKTIFESHLAKSIKLAENKIQNTFHCKTVDCKGWCIYDDNVNIFNCPICKINNCLTCQAIHEGKNCKEYQSEIKIGNSSTNEGEQTRDMLDEMVRKGEALACPTCQVILMKKWGCDWVKCSMCRTEICWVTRGPRWGPNGKGDISAGCQCGVDGLKCHPKCNYCH